MSAKILEFRPRPSAPPKPAKPASVFDGEELVPSPCGPEYPISLVLGMLHPENLLLLRRVQSWPRPFPPTGAA